MEKMQETWNLKPVKAVKTLSVAQNSGQSGFELWL